MREKGEERRTKRNGKVKRERERKRARMNKE